MDPAQQQTLIDNSPQFDSVIMKFTVEAGVVFSFILTILCPCQGYYGFAPRSLQMKDLLTIKTAMKINNDRAFESMIPLFKLDLPYQIMARLSSSKNEERANVGTPDCLGMHTCRLVLDQRLERLGIRLCFHHPTGLIGHCWSRQDQVCNMNEVISCHPFPHLAEFLFKAFGGLDHREQERQFSKVFVYTKEDSKLENLTDFMERMFKEEIISRDMTNRDQELNRVDSFIENAISGLARLAEDVVVLVGSGIKEAQNMIEKSLTKAKEENIDLEDKLIIFEAHEDKEDEVEIELGKVLHEILHGNENSDESCIRGPLSQDWTRQTYYGLFDPLPVETIAKEPVDHRKMQRVCKIEQIIKALMNKGGEQLTKAERVKLRSTLIQIISDAPQLDKSPIFVPLEARSFASSGLRAFVVREDVGKFFSSLDEEARGRTAQQDVELSDPVPRDQRSIAFIIRSVLSWPVNVKILLHDFLQGNVEEVNNATSKEDVEEVHREDLVISRPEKSGAAHSRMDKYCKVTEEKDICIDLDHVLMLRCPPIHVGVVTQYCTDRAVILALTPSFRPESERPESRLIGTASSSWPWFNRHNQSDKKDCRCLRTPGKFGLVFHPKRTCSQAIPWCYVDSQSGCQDAGGKISGFRGLTYSHKACSNEKYVQSSWRFF